MKGYVPVDVPTKPYIKAWMHAELGEKPVMSQSHHIGSKFVDLLERKSNYQKTIYSADHYPATVRVYINKHCFNKKGCHIHETNILAFNNYMESYLKSQVRFMLDVYFEMTKSVEASIEIMRDRIGIPEEHFPYDTVKKDYYRYRKSKGIIFPKGGYKKLTATTIHMIL